MTLIGRAAVLDRPNGRFFVQEYEVPEPAPGTFILKVDLTGICGTDAHMYQGQLAGVPYPLILGHEITGKVFKLGRGVTEDTIGNPVREGDQIILVPGVPCGNCYYCKVQKTPTRCERLHAFGFEPVEEIPLAGGYSEYVYAQFPNCSFVKTVLPPEIAVLTEPVSIAVHGIERAGMRLGSIAVIQGSGAIGLGCLVMAQKSGAYKTIVIGGLRRRLELAKDMGADVVIDIDEIQEPAERIKLVKDETPRGRGADVVFECTGFPSSIPEGMSYLRDSGKYIELGHFTDVGPVEINPHIHWVKKNVDLHACWGSDVQHISQALPFLEKRDYPYEKWVSHRLGLTEVQDGIDAIARKGWRLRGRDPVIKIAIDPWKDHPQVSKV